MKQSRITNIYEWFRAAMAAAGRNVEFPKDTDPTKTYQYRWYKKFAEYVDELEIPDEMIKSLICEIVSYAKENRIIDRGAALLRMKKVIAACCDRMEERLENKDIAYEEIQKCREFLDRKGTNVLLRRKNPWAYTNIIRWYQSSDITTPFIAVSKSCREALAGLDASERCEIPSDDELTKCATKLIDQDGIQKLKRIMGQDLANIGV